MKKHIITKIFAVFLMFGLLMSSEKTVHAYVFNGYPYSSVGNLSFYAASDSSYDFTSMMDTYTKKWNGIAGISWSKTSSPSSCDLHQSVYNSDNGTYGVCTYVSKSYKKIVYYKSFLGTTTTRKQETIVHEVGHSLGLSHTQSSNESNSVMRALGFNDKPYPLSDDKNGLNALY